MSKGEQSAAWRAAYLLRIVNKFIHDNPVSDYTIYFDEAVCDGACLADDCLVAAEELERVRNDRDSIGGGNER